VRARGLRATVGSLHINGWIARALLDRDLEAELNQWLYIGDSTNDQVMFAHLSLTVGVANFMRFASHLNDPPKYITSGERGGGFAEMVSQVLKR
jgi:hydroxymethylpyrimidine pyrophosphatase-like HAD family hydrolase